MNTFVVTFVYPGAEKWFDDFVICLKNQSDQNFEIIVFQDGIEARSLFNVDNLKFTFYQIVNAKSPYEVRLKSLQVLRGLPQNSILIFSDIDDLMSSKRVEETKRALVNPDEKVVCSDLSLIDNQGNFLETQVWKTRNIQKINYEDLTYFNMIGFGSVAVKSDVIPENTMELDYPVLVGDWFFFFCLLKDHQYQATFIAKDLVYYRQHVSNETGLKAVTDEKLQRDLKSMILHYSAINTRYQDLGSAKRLEELKQIESFIQIKQNRLTYLEKINALYRSDYYWWEHIKTLNEVGIYDY